MSQDFYNWPKLKELENDLRKLVDLLSSQSPFLMHFKKQLYTETSTDLFVWVDHISISESHINENQLIEYGYEKHSNQILIHPKAYFPIIQVSSSSQNTLAIKVEWLEDFIMMQSIETKIEHAALSPYRSATIEENESIKVIAVERHGYNGLGDNLPNPISPDLYIECINLWKTRPRSLETPQLDIEKAISIAKDMTSKVGPSYAADIVLRVEREYWMARNLAGTIQKMRQDSLGLGWANQDHHTFRSSRSEFIHLIHLFESLGFYCRERFYAGNEAGWGAQVMEHQYFPFVLFLDVDLSEKEIQIDFAHTPLEERSELGTIGLWCRLHGSSILKAGMHHLEAQFDFEKLSTDLKDKYNISQMAPFSNFPHLKQAFTEGQIWQVNKNTLDELLKEGHIDKLQYDKFIIEGALGSHLENLERHEGYKGFNQKNVSDIIKRTDPRHTFD